MFGRTFTSSLFQFQEIREVIARYDTLTATHQVSFMLIRPEKISTVVTLNLVGFTYTPWTLWFDFDILMVW